MKIAIIGAGITGLAAAFKLKEAGLSPTIFEKSPFIGGRTSSEKIEGFVLEKGAYTIPEYHKNLLALIDKLDLSDNLIEISGNSSLYRNGQEHKLEIGAPIDFMKFKLLSLRSKKELIKIYLHNWE